MSTRPARPELAQSSLSRVVVLPGDRRFLVAPPTIRDAVEILEGLAGGDDDGSVVEEALLRWLPTDVIAGLILMEPAERTTMLQGLIFQGVDLASMRERAKRRSIEEKDKEPAPFDWRLVLSDYCQIYHAGDPWDVYRTTPFPFFMSMLEVSASASVREVLRWVELELVPHVGKNAQNILDAMRRRAQGVESMHPRPAYADRETIERERAELKAALQGGRP